MRNTRREFIKHSTIASIGSALLPISAHGQNNRVRPAPMMPEPHFMQSNGIDMAVYEKGEGPAVVFCHGWPELAFSWRSQIDAVAAAGFALEVNKAQRDLGTSFKQTSQILATSKAVAAVNKLNGMTQEDTLNIIKGIASEFGSFSDATASATLQASNLVANFGVGTEQVGKLARNIQAVSGGTLESSLDSAEFLANMARAADVPVGDVMNDVANNTALFARFGKEGGRNIAEAAIPVSYTHLTLPTKRIV